MIRGAESPPAIDTDLQIMKAGKEHALLVGNLICAGFGMPDHLLPVFASLLNNPNNHVYLATDDDVPIGVGVLTVHNDIGHLNTATTMQAYRGRGVQGALMAHRINEGIRMGCQWFATETGILPDQPNPSYNNQQTRVTVKGYTFESEMILWILPWRNKRALIPPWHQASILLHSRFKFSNRPTNRWFHT